MYAHELYEQNKPKIVVTYPGRFQPFHQGHAGVFAKLQKQFGRDSVYILTSNDTSSAKSPFNFSDKYQLMTAAGVPGDKIIETNQMYKLPDSIDAANTIFITAVGAPDADRLNPDTYTKRDQKDKEGNVTKPAGSPSYYKTWGGPETPVTADQHGYVIVIPEIHKEVTIKGQKYDVSHGTECRNLWNSIRNDAKARTEFLSQMYARPSQELAAIFDKIPQTTSEDISADSQTSTSPIHGTEFKQAVAEGLDEAVGGNYLYHATSADGLKGMLSSGSIRSATGPQAATQAQTKLPTVSVTRDWGYASGSNAVDQMAGIGRDAILVLDRNAVESNFKTLGTSQNTNIRGLAFNPYLRKDGEARSQNTDPMARANAKAKAKYAEPTAKAGGEFEEAVVVPKGALPLKGTMVGFWINPKSELMKDPAVMNDPRRLDMVRPNQFVQAKQSQGVAEGGAETSWSNDTDTITLQDILELTKHIKQINLPINDNLKSKLLHWEGNPEEIERVNQVTVSNQFPILIMVDEQGQIAWILDGNHRLHKAIQSQAKTIPAKLIRPSNLDDKAKKIFNIKEQGVAEDAAGVGVVAKNKKMARDPRYSMSITKDVKPSTPKNMLRAFRLSEQEIEEGIHPYGTDIWGRPEMPDDIKPASYVFPGIISAYKAAQKQGMKVVKSAGGRFKLAPLNDPNPELVPNPKFPEVKQKVQQELDKLQSIYDSVGKTMSREDFFNQYAGGFGQLRKQMSHWNKVLSDTPTFVEKSSAIKEDENNPTEKQIMSMVKNFLPLVMKELKIKKLPKIIIKKHIETTDGQATFGRFVNEEEKIYLGIADRHPVDILRTLAHELVHFKQYEQGRMEPDSGDTGSPIENEANAVAGVLMRYFNKKYPDAVKSSAVSLDESLFERYQQFKENGDEPDEVRKQKNLIPFPKGTVKVDVSDVYDWYKLGQEISDLDDANPADFGKGPPQTVMAFGSEPEEHRYLKDLKRLGLKTHDIDENFADGRNPQDKGDSKRYKVPTKGKISTLRKIAKQGGRRGQLAHWMANMRSGKNKK